MDRLHQYRLIRGTARWQGAWLDADQEKLALSDGWKIEHKSEMVMTRNDEGRLIPHPATPVYR